MHTQSEQKKAQISRNAMMNKHLRDLTLFLHYMRLHNLHPGYIIWFLQTLVTQEVVHKLHKLRVFEKRESYICTFFIFLKIYTPHCAFLTLSKMLRLVSLYIKICNLCNLCNLLLYFFFWSRVMRSTCFVTICNFLKKYVTLHNVRGGMLGFVTQGAHHTCKKHTLKN
jgi:hypothetical protein